MTRDGVLVFGSFELALSTYELKRCGVLVRVQRKPLDLLVYLIQHRCRVVSKEELLTALWPGMNVSEHALTSALRDLRRALGDDGSLAHRVVATLRGRGFQFVPALTRQPTPLPTPEVDASDVILHQLRSSLEEAARGPFRITVARESDSGGTRLVIESLPIPERSLTKP